MHSNLVVLASETRVKWCEDLWNKKEEDSCACDVIFLQSRLQSDTTHLNVECYRSSVGFVKDPQLWPIAIFELGLSDVVNVVGFPVLHFVPSKLARGFMANKK